MDTIKNSACYFIW